MAIGRRAKTPPVAPRPRAIVAASATVSLDGTSWKTWKLGDQRWQDEAWRMYDIIPELRYGMNWTGSAVSRCRLYIAEVKPDGKPGDEVTDEKLTVIAETAFGGPAEKAEAQRLLAIQLSVSGESFIVAESVDNAKEDRWYVVSSSEIRRIGSSGIQVSRSQMFGGGTYKLDPKKDLLLRCWTPHPRFYDHADSAVRASLPVLRETEQLTKKIFAEIDSRLAGAGVLFLPEEIEFPPDPDEEGDQVGGATGLMTVLRKAMEKSLQDQSDPASLVPIMVQVAGEFIDKIKWVTFATPFAAETLNLRTEAIRRLALGLDLPPEILLGQGSTNHWGAWQIEESVIKLQIEPLLARIADALTKGYLRPALKAAGIKDPEKYTFWFDTSPLAIRPDRQADAFQMYGVNAIGQDSLRKAGNWNEDDAPTKDEMERQLALQLIQTTPALLASPDIQKALGISWDVSAALGGAAPVPTDQAAIDATTQRGLPSMPQDTATPAQEAALLVGADMVMRRAFELAGKRLLVRGNRGQFANVATTELHTKIAVDADQADRLLDGAWDQAAALAARLGIDPQVMVNMLDTYARTLLVRGQVHDYGAFASYLDKALLMVGHRACADNCRIPMHPGDCPTEHARVPVLAGAP